MGGLISMMGGLISKVVSACKKRATEHEAMGGPFLPEQSFIAMGGPFLPEQSFMGGPFVPEQSFMGPPNPSNGRNPQWSPNGSIKRKPRTYSGDLTPWGNPI
jgi:hypothetical protein